MRTFSIIANEDKDQDNQVLRTVIRAFAGRSRILTEVVLHGEDRMGHVDVVKGEALFTQSEAVIVLGGDGSILSAAAKAAVFATPVFGINLGTIGFLASIEREQADMAADILLGGKYTIEKRMMIESHIKGEDKALALNDFVISRGNYPHMIEIAITIDGEHLNAFTADGVIISSPTGSTAYSLAAGGPIMDPTMEGFIINPICAHDLNSRPVVLPAHKEIGVCIKGRYEGSAVLIADGREKMNVAWGQKISIQKSQFAAELISLPGRGFYGLVRKKLG